MKNTIHLPVLLLTEFCTSKLGAVVREFCWGGGGCEAEGERIMTYKIQNVVKLHRSRSGLITVIGNP